ncbi:MAG: hypothetical protein IPH41_07110 [Sulfuritalea sp.]|jgi:hypothetical protein|nr:hypothetical protein [Sulfuritalea sp.]
MVISLIEVDPSAAGVQACPEWHNGAPQYNEFYSGRWICQENPVAAQQHLGGYQKWI